MGDLARLFYTNKIKSTPATLTALSEATSYPVENLYDDNYASVWRSTAADSTTQTIVADFGSAVAISACALGNVNIRSTATVKIQGHTADSWGTPDVDETIVVTGLTSTAYRRNLYHAFNSASKRYWRLTILDNGNTDGFIEIGEWFLGVPIELDQNYDGSNIRRLIRNNIQHQTEYGQNFVYTRDWGWMLDWSFTNATETLRDQLRLLAQSTFGQGLPFFLVPDPSATPAEALYVRMLNELEEQRVNHDVYSMKMQFMEEMPGLVTPR